MKEKDEKSERRAGEGRESRNTESRVGMGGGSAPGLLGRWGSAGTLLDHWVAGLQLGCWVLASAVQEVLAGGCVDACC